MILHRYINRQLLTTTIVVTVVLMMVLVSGRFIKYLASAATGEISADVLFVVILYRMPEFLQLILPLSVFISILLVLGRMYSDSEMAVLRSGGIGQSGIVRGLIAPMLVTTFVVGLFGLYVTPYGETEVARVLEEQRGRSVLELLTPGRFHSRGDKSGMRTAYAESLNREEEALENIFISDFRYAGDDSPGSLLTVMAGRGRVVERDGLAYLYLEEGFQYQGAPGDPDYRRVEFSEAMVKIGEERSVAKPPKVRSLPTMELLVLLGADARAELQWRISLVLLVPMMLIAAVPLSQVSPRQGQFNRLAPALLFYLGYVGLLLVMRSRLAKMPIDEIGWQDNMYLVHVVAFAAVALLLNEHRLRLWLADLRRRPA
ncbi:MAG: LPS export ABC transporter permease LptF [Alcanivoracaceae bacterium]|nr:LPS export ABC transporter permease LptF [Alcanivoracaceae bacterium]